MAISAQDQKLLVRLKMGEAQAVRQWFTSYQSQLKKIVSAKVSDLSDAEELTQDTFISCLKHLPLFRGDSSIWTWMLRIAHHEIADYYRKRYAKKAIHALQLDELLALNQITDAHETAQLVKQTLKQLKKEHQELLLLKYVDKKAVAEIAALFGRTVKSVESDLFRARQEFRLAYATVLKEYTYE